MGSRSFTVPGARSHWTDTGVVLAPGESLSVAASGIVTFEYIPTGIGDFTPLTYWHAYPEGTYPDRGQLVADGYYHPESVSTTLLRSGDLVAANLTTSPYCLALAVVADGAGSPPDDGTFADALRPNRLASFSPGDMNGGAGGRVWLIFNDQVGWFHADSGGPATTNTGSFTVTLTASSIAGAFDPGDVSACPPRTAPVDVEARFFSASTGKRLFVDPDTVVSLRWGYSEVGGMDQAEITFALGFDPSTLAVTGQDRVEFWVIGESSPRWLGTVGQVEAVLEVREQKKLVCYGPLEDMNRVILDKVILHPGGADLKEFAAEILADYLKRRPALLGLVDTDIQETGITLERVTLRNGAARAATEQVMATAAGNCVWGWEVSPETKHRRFYVRPRVTTVFRQYFVGEDVQLLHAPSEYQGIVNAAKVMGGPLKFPQLIKNPSFEDPSIPTEASGSLLTDGGFENNTGWTYLSGASRQQSHTSNLDNSARSGSWCLELDNAGEEARQDATITPGKTYKVLCYAAREFGTGAATGRLIVEVGSDTYTLALAPPSTAWQGGQDATVLGGDNLSLTFLHASATSARVRLVCDSGSVNHGLLIDDVTLAAVDAVGQEAWGTHLQHEGDSANKFGAIDWNCRDGAWEGVSFVRVQILAADQDHKPVLNPLGGDNGGVAGAHFQPMPQQSLRVGFRVRMMPGTGAGEGRVEYREWTGAGREDAVHYGPYVTIPDDGAWHFYYEDVTAHGDAASATMQWAFSAPGTYDIDGATARDTAAGEGTLSDALGFGEFQRSERFERYVTAEEVCTPGSDAYDSFSTYGRQEGVFTNEGIIYWNAAAQAAIKAAFERYAVVAKRPKLTLVHDTRLPFLAPSSGQRVRVSGLSEPFADSWPARTEYTWASGLLSVGTDLNRERPTLPKLLSRAQTQAGGGGVSVGAAFGGSGSSTTGNGSGVTTPAPAAITVGDGSTEYFPVEVLDFPVGIGLVYDEDTDTVTATPDGKVLASATDTTRGYLYPSLAEGTGIVLTLLNEGMDETVEIAVDPSVLRARYLPIANGDRYNPCVVFTDGALVLTEY